MQKQKIIKQNANVSGLDVLFKIAVEQKASDLHLVVGQAPLVRIDGALKTIEGQAVLTKETMQELLYGIVSETQKQKLEEYNNKIQQKTKEMER